MASIKKSRKLESVCYDIRGPVLKAAKRLEEEGHRILKLNIGNPAPFGFEAPDELLQDVIRNLPQAQGYCDSKGLYAARKAVMQRTQQQGIQGVDVEDVFIGNGVSELIVMAMQGLINDGDEVLVPAPDYPLWTAAVTLAGGKAVHYRCDEGSAWHPDLEDLESKVSERTRGLVVINPNNPTGAVYERAMVEALGAFATRHDLVLFADEIYDRILYDGAVHIPLASVAEEALVLTFGGLSKNYRAAGFRTGWMVCSGELRGAEDYLEGLEMLASMRLCANVPTQHAVQGALGGHQSINDLVCPGGALHEQRALAYEALTALPGVSCVKPLGGLYLFPRLDPDHYRIEDDEKFVLDLLTEEKLLLVQGTAFNLPDRQHQRWVFLPRQEELRDALGRFERFLSRHHR